MNKLLESWAKAGVRVVGINDAWQPWQKEKPSGALTVKQAAERLGVSKETIYGLCSDGSMPHTRIGKRITITEQQLQQYQRSADR